MHYVKQLIVVSLILSTLSACRTTKQVSAKTDRDSSKIPGAVGEPGPKISGPRYTIAIEKFDVIASLRGQYGGADIGRELATMLASSLRKSNQFIVLERADLDKILREHQITGEGLSLKGTAPELGKIIGVDYLIKGSVAEFSTDDKGGGVSLGFSGGEFGKLINGALSRQASSGSIAVDIHLINTTTAQALGHYSVREKIKSSAFDIVGGFKGFNLGKNLFRKTPLGEAARKAIDQAVNEIVTEAKSQPWKGRVVEVTGNQIYINAGSIAGIRGEKSLSLNVR